MPAFANPFAGNIKKKMDNTELAQALRIDLASEIEAIFLYEAHAAATDDSIAKKVLLDISREEMEHMGELMTLMRHLDPKIVDEWKEGEGEVVEMAKKLGLEI